MVKISYTSLPRINVKDLARRRFPILGWLPQYTISKFFHDLLAGFTVGLTEIPQAIAFAGIAGLTPEYGLYSGFMDGFIYAIFGTCKDINIGPTSILALMLQRHVTNLGPDMAVLMTFIKGVIIFILAILNLGFVIEFFSYPIVAGFTCGASLQIASSQIKSLLGIPGKANEFLEAWETVFSNLDQIKLWDTVLGICSIIFLTALKEIRRFGTLTYRKDWSRNQNILGIFLFILSLARNALVVIIGTAISYNLRDDIPFAITGNVKAGFPPFQPPPFTTTFNGTFYTFAEIAEEYSTTIIFLPIVSILEAVSIAKAFSKGRTLNATQEMFALGLCNIMGSFVSSMPVTGSFTRTAVNNASGVKTCLGGIATSIMVLLSIAFLTSTFYYIPKATLASVVFCAMFYLFDFKAFVLLWKNKKQDLVPFLTTFLCCIFISLEYGILIGIVVNLLFVLYASARPKININENENSLIFTPRDTLFFPCADFLRDNIFKNEDSEAVVVVDGRNLRTIDITMAKSLCVLMEEMELRGQKLIFVNFKESIIKVCVGVNEKVERYFKSENVPTGITSWD